MTNNGKTRAAHPNRLVFSSDARDKRALPGRLGCVKHSDRAAARGDHCPVGEADPLTLVLPKELVADSPIRGLVVAPRGIDLAGDFGGVNRPPDPGVTRCRHS